MDSASLVQRFVTGFVITTIPYLILPILICSRIYKKKGSVNYSRVIIINTIIVFAAFFVLHLFADRESPNVTAAFIWGGVCYAICNNKYGRQRKEIGKEPAANQAEPSALTRNEPQRSKDGEGRAPFILIVHIGSLVVAGIIVAAFFITGGSVLTEEERDSIIEEAYESGYKNGKREKDSLDELLWTLRASGAYDEGYKTGYDHALSDFVEYADRVRGKNLRNLYTDFVYQGHDDKPSGNPYS